MFLLSHHINIYYYLNGFDFKYLLAKYYNCGLVNFHAKYLIISAFNIQAIGICYCYLLNYEYKVISMYQNHCFLNGLKRGSVFGFALQNIYI